MDCCTYLFTVKPLLADPPKSDEPLYSDHIACPRLSYIETSSFGPSERRPPPTSLQRPQLLSPGDYKLIQKTSESDQDHAHETTPLNVYLYS